MKYDWKKLDNQHACKVIVVLAITILIAGSVTSLTSAAAFTDVSSKYQESVDFVVSKGIKGKTTTTFGTSENIKRVDAAVMLVMVLGLDIDAAPASGFTDVPKRAVKHINALKAAKITSGKTTTTFDSESQITRGELAIWIQRGFELQANGDALPFEDVATRYQSAVSALVSNEITSGTSPTTFGTTNNAKRGDFAIFLKRADDVVSSSGDLEVIGIE